MALTWNDKLQEKLIQEYGKKKGLDLSNKYVNAFPHSYMDDYASDVALLDIASLEKISAENPLAVDFYVSADKSAFPLHLRLFQWQTAIPLSDVMPMLENMGLRANNEFPHKITLNNQFIWISDFSVVYDKPEFDINKVKSLIQDAFINIRAGFAENDGFNKLILSASLNWREIIILRAYVKYLRQIGFRFSQPYIEKTLSNQPAVARDLVDLFLVLHNPAGHNKEKNLAEQIEKRILQELEAVTSLDEDRILRRLLALIKATLRTNYFQKSADGKHKDYLSLKLDSHAIPDMPLPKPMYEIFVYATRFEGIHLRNAKVARGGIRWSDRLEDFRTEILGLMKAQKVKNSVIVPSGAKGGFVLKAVSSQTTREPLKQEVVNCYTSFISGLLDLTDNIVNNKYVHPENIVCYDDFDPYLVVAADKGTATFSDTANAISKKYSFWLGDAFASGGSTGYDHKKMGITARGAWESVKRHFRECDIDLTKSIITVAGIGDMSGDVFGNGMIYSKRIKLVAAFDHRHIFIDPDPDPEVSYYERVRLFNLPASSWEDYNAKLISKGGGVFKRSQKSISLTQQMKKVLAVEDSSLSPLGLIRAILKAPVDLLFNGGIGTYVKSSRESQADVGDRTNDYCRVNGDDLRCRVVGEGGNLGFTQLGRVEYALKGGLINTDFIDNSAGVDCSDHEVNLKILLDNEIHNGKLNYDKRNEFLASMTQEVSDLVLTDNYFQALVMSFASFHSNKNINLHASYLKELETLGVLDREVEFLPSEKEILARKAAEQGFTRPELAVLLAYSKIYIKQEILKSTLPEDPYLKQSIETAFPLAVRKKYQSAMQDHRLHRDIIATQLSNHIINEMGITFVYRLQMETGAPIDQIIRAYTVASHIFNTIDLKRKVEELDYKIPMETQYEMLFNIRHLINLTSRWFLHTNYLKDNLQEVIEHYSSRVKKLENLIPSLMSGVTKDYLHKIIMEFMQAGIEEDLAQRIGTYRAIYTSLNIIDISTIHNFDLIKTAKVYFAAGEKINLVWFRDQIAVDSREGHWNVLARLTLRDELDVSQRALTIAIMKKDKKSMDPFKLIDQWLTDNETPLKRWNKLLEMLHGSTTIEYSMFFIAIRELLGLIQTSQ